jgi:hypothetical protein
MALAVGALKICCRPQCSMFGVPQPIGRFHRDRSARDGLHAYCKSCCRDYSRDQKVAISAYQKSWANRNPIRRKAGAVRNNLRKILRKLGRSHEAFATRPELENGLTHWIAETDFPATPENLRYIHCCHRVPLRRGGTCTVDNLFWGWGDLNVRASWATPDMVIRLIRDFLWRMEHPPTNAVLRTTESDSIQTAKSA